MVQVFYFIWAADESLKSRVIKAVHILPDILPGLLKFLRCHFGVARARSYWLAMIQRDDASME